MYKKTVLIACAVFAFLPKQAVPQKKNDTYRIIVSCSCSDSVGKLYATDLRDLIANSPRYGLVDDTADNRKNSLMISVVSIAIDDDTNGNAGSGALSVVFRVGDTFMDQYIQVCGKKNTATCAKSVLSSLDSDISLWKAQM